MSTMRAAFPSHSFLVVIVSLGLICGEIVEVLWYSKVFKLYCDNFKVMFEVLISLILSIYVTYLISLWIINITINHMSHDVHLPFLTTLSPLVQQLLQQHLTVY